MEQYQGISIKIIGDNFAFVDGKKVNLDTKAILYKNRIVVPCINEGNDWIVGGDLRDYFGTVSHELLINLIARKISDGKIEMKVHEKTIKKLRDKLKNLTGRSRIGDIKIKQLVIGWVNYFKLAHMKGDMIKLDMWLRRRIRMCYWKQWKKVSIKFNNLKKLGISKHKARKFANTRKGYWHIANSPILAMSITNARLEKAGLVSLIKTYAAVS